MDTERDLNDDSDIGWPPRPWDIEWAKKWTTLPEESWGALDPDDEDPASVTDPEPCEWCGQPPASTGGWAPGEMLDHVRDVHPELMPAPSTKVYPPRQPGVVLPPAP